MILQLQAQEHGLGNLGVSTYTYPNFSKFKATFWILLILIITTSMLGGVVVRCKGAVSMLVGLTMRSYWLGSICFACLHYLLAYMLVRFALIFVTLLALTAEHRFDGFLALLNWVLI